MHDSVDHQCVPQRYTHFNQSRHRQVIERSNKAKAGRTQNIFIMLRADRGGRDMNSPARMPYTAASSSGLSQLESRGFITIVTTTTQYDTVSQTNSAIPIILQ